jgi:2-polyprenyl-3-methyl-5-hydroxy-6-metoxy-1,4-benzoquinol methylase
MKIDTQVSSQLRLLLVIASFGQKNLALLKRIITQYQRMALDVDIVVVSEGPKDLGPDVEVLVGLPTQDPWSLPFAHKAVMLQKANDYDLFVYSEDDMVVTEENLRAFIQVTPLLAADEIAGFLRYEVDSAGNRFLPDVRECFRWKPESVRTSGSLTVAEFTNEHAGFYLLTRDQLRRAIASGGFMGAPHRRGRYGTPETAATDPYTSCGFHKVICIQDLESFFIHHASNRYVGSFGISLESFQEQIHALIEISDSIRPAKTLCAIEPKVLIHNCKNLYDLPDRDWLGVVPKEARSVLSIGCGWGAFEAELQLRGASVTALAVDSVVGANAERRGVKMIYGTLDEGLQTIKSRQFDCIVMDDLIHLLPNPVQVIEACSHLLRRGGRLLLSGPNFNRLPVFIKRKFLNGEYRKLRTFAESGIHVCGPSSVARMLERSGFRFVAVRWLNHIALLGKGGPPAIELGSLTAKGWILVSESL